MALTHISGAQASRPFDPYAETSTREVSGGRSAPETSYLVDRTHMGRRGTTAGHLLSTDLPIWRWGPLTFKGPLTVSWIGHFHADE